MLKITHLQQGVSLIESLIALLVISIGLLGIAALQITSMGESSSAANHSQAVWIANSMADRIRANAEVDTITNQFTQYAGVDTNAGYSQECITLNCSADQMVAADAADWANMVSALPSGRGMVDDNAPDGLLLKVMWDDAGTDATGTGCGPNPAVDLTCYTVVITQ